jgi:hypothetical protein
MRARKRALEDGDLRSSAMEDLSVVRRSLLGALGLSIRITLAPLLARRSPQKGPRKAG